jgi:DegV family protein with EDD domain
MLRIATDSTCDLPPEYFRQYDITVVPIPIFFGTESYQDGVTIDRSTLYRKIEALGVVPKTSQPSAGQFQAVYNKMADEGATEILSLHVGAKLSGTYQAAELGGRMVADRVHVIPFDSGCGSAGMGYMVLEALRMSEAGKTVGEIVARLEAIRPRITIVLTVRDLRFAQMSGRISRLQSSLASLLHIKPIVVLKDGLLSVGDKVRTQQKAVEQMLRLTAERVGTTGPANLAAVHAEAGEAAQELLEQAKAAFDCREAFVTELAASLGVHFGPGTIGLVGYRV